MQRRTFKTPVLVTALAVGASVGVVGSGGGAAGASAHRTATASSAPSAAPSGASDNTVVRNVVFAVHGGAGSIERGSISPEQEKAYRDGLAKAVRTGYAKLKRGKSSLDATEAAVRVLEDDSNFNAGKGAVFTTDGAHELDASIMDGRDLDSGAVAGVSNTKNPISLARMVKERSRHVLYAGRGADTFALRNGVPFTTQDYFFTQRRWDELMDAKRRAGGSSTGDAAQTAEAGATGTVGAVAVDRRRNIAAATSTGGLTNKDVGRVGDSPNVGAGTYADNRTVAVSCTGTGEVFIRAAAAHDISAMMGYTGKPVQDAAAEVITEKIPALDATGAAIALDPKGNLATPHSSATILNGYITRSGKIVTRIYNDETPET